jgi:hypothetical protein
VLSSILSFVHPQRRRAMASVAQSWRRVASQLPFEVYVTPANVALLRARLQLAEARGPLVGIVFADSLSVTDALSVLNLEVQTHIHAPAT